MAEVRSILNSLHCKHRLLFQSYISLQCCPRIFLQFIADVAALSSRQLFTIKIKLKDNNLSSRRPYWKDINGCYVLFCQYDTWIQENGTRQPPHSLKSPSMNCKKGGGIDHLKTSDVYRTCRLPKRFEYPSWFYGYGIQRVPPEHPFYRTTTSEYGR